MEVIAEIRRRHLVSKESISSIARDLKLSRPTVRKHLQTESEAVYLRQHQPAPKLGDFQSVLESWLTTERHLPKAQRRTAQRLFEGLQAEGYRGAYDSVQNFPDFRGDQRPKVVTLGCVTSRRFSWGIWGVKHGSYS